MPKADAQTEAGGLAPPADRSGNSGTVKVWDPLVRLFHWSLVVAFFTAWATGDEWKSVHEKAGYVIVGLLAVRIVWGIIGTRHARFSDFIYRPSTVLRYLADTVRLRAKRYIGHNPAGGAMVLALIVMLAATTATGIMMTTDTWWGVGWVEELHEVVANLTVVMVGLHIIGVVAASFELRENLIWSMISGRKRRAADHPHPDL